MLLHVYVLLVVCPGDEFAFFVVLRARFLNGTRHPVVWIHFGRRLLSTRRCLRLCLGLPFSGGFTSLAI